MKNLSRSAALVAAFLVCGLVFAGPAVPINTTFGIQWTPVDWSNPKDRVTESMGAAGLPNGSVISIATRDHLDAVDGKIASDYVVIVFLATDWVYARYDNIPAVYYPATNTASFFGPLSVLGGEGRFRDATGTLSIHTTIQFDPLPVGVFDIKGVIRTAN